MINKPKSIVELIFENAGKAPASIALIKDNVTITYKELSDRIRYASLEFSKRGLLEGDRIILSASKGLSFIYGYFGAHLNGIIIVPVDPSMPITKIVALKEQVEASLVYWHDATDNFENIADFEKLLEEKKLDETVRFPCSAKPADIVFTSGTTGDAKGVVLSHFNHFSAIQNINSFIGNNNNDIEILIMPLSHSFGMTRMRCVLGTGGSLILVDGLLRPKNFFAALKNNKATGIGMVPAAWAVLQKISGKLISKYQDQINYIEFGSAPMPDVDKKSIMECLPSSRICMHYGLTEASRTAFIEFHSDCNNLHTVGKASPNVDIIIINNNGDLLEKGEIGELCVRGGMVFREYWQNPDLTKKSFIRDYFKTGDLARILENNYIELIGREKEMINVGGKKVSPVEIEKILTQHPLINECVCVGIEDALSGESVHACIVLEDKNKAMTELEFKRFLSDKLEHYKIPTSYSQISNIPRTSSGKIQRLTLKKEINFKENKV